MKRHLIIQFDLELEDEFMDAVKEYVGVQSDDDLLAEDITQFIENNIKPARSCHPSFKVIGGDTDGWFVKDYGFE